MRSAVLYHSVDDMLLECTEALRWSWLEAGGRLAGQDETDTRALPGQPMPWRCIISDL